MRRSAVARAAGETAPILFTSHALRQTTSPDPRHPVASIPFMIFTYSESPDPHLHEQAWAAAFVLIVFVLTTSLTARFLLHRGSPKARAEARARRNGPSGRSQTFHQPFTGFQPTQRPRRLPTLAATTRSSRERRTDT